MVDNTLSQDWTSAPIGRIAAPLREQVVEQLRLAIFEERLKPGQRLIERELIELLGVSRTTVREAIRELNSQGIVTVVPQRGAIVAEPTQSDAVDFYEVRAALESLMVRRFVERADDELVDELQASVGELRKVVNQTSDVRAILAAKERFYRVLFVGARSTAIRENLESIQSRVQAMRSSSLAVPGRPTKMVQELQDLVDAIRERNVEDATRLCALHVRNAGSAALGVEL